MKGADGQEWTIFIVIDWLSRLMILSGNAAVFTSNAALGHLLSAWGSSIFLATFVCRMCIDFPSLATSRLDFAATTFEAFGSVSILIARHYFAYNGDMFFVWLYIIGNILFFIGGLLNTQTVFEIQEMKRLQDHTRIAQGTGQSHN